MADEGLGGFAPEAQAWPRGAYYCLAPGCKYLEGAPVALADVPRCPAHGTFLAFATVAPVNGHG